MRALSFSRLGYRSRVGIAAIFSSRAWCSTDTKADNNDIIQNDKDESREKELSNQTLKALEKEIEESKKTVDNLKKEVLYRAADAENARRIGREDVEKAKLYGITSFAKDMLDVADTLEKGIEAFGMISDEILQENKTLNSIRTGVKLSIKVLHKNMSKHGIEKMNVSIGTAFDPNMHEALVRVPATDKAPAETVAQILKDGYTIKNRVLRAAQVGVSHAPDE